MKINYKNSTLILLILSVLFGFITLVMPSKDKIKDVEVRKIEVKQDELMNFTVYTVTMDSNNIENHNLSLKQDSVDDLLKEVINDMIKNYSSNLELVNLYFGDNIVYYEFSDNNLSEAFLEALKLNTKEVTGIENIDLVKGDRDV